MQKVDSDEVRRLWEDCTEKNVTVRASGIEGETTLGRERIELMCRVRLMTAERDSENARYLEASPGLLCILNAGTDKKDKAANTLVKLCNLFEPVHKVAVLTHQAKLAKHKAKVAFLMGDLDVKELEL